MAYDFITLDNDITATANIRDVSVQIDHPKAQPILTISWNEVTGQTRMDVSGVDFITARVVRGKLRESMNIDDLKNISPHHTLDGNFAASLGVEDIDKDGVKTVAELFKMNDQQIILSETFFQPLNIA